MSTTRYLVISYHCYDQETFFDFVEIDDSADNPYGDARAIVDTVRPDAIASYAGTPEDLRTMATNLESESTEAIWANIKKLAEASDGMGELTDLQVLPCAHGVCGWCEKCAEAKTDEVLDHAHPGPECVYRGSGMWNCGVVDQS